MTNYSFFTKILGADLKKPVDIIIINTPASDYTDKTKPEIDQLAPLGLAHMATEAGKAGFNAGLLDADWYGMTPAEITNVINTLKPRWVTLNMFTPNHRLVGEIIRGLDPQVKIEIGGSHAQAMPERVLRELANVPNEIIVSLGDGEIQIPAMLRAETDEALYKIGNMARLNEAGEYIAEPDFDGEWSPKNLDEYIIDRQYLPNNGITISEERKETTIITSRGCPFRCTFCSGARDVTNEKLRERSIESIIKEIKFLNEEYNITAIRFIDDLFLARPKRIEEFCRAMINSGLNKIIDWDSTGRANIIERADDELINLIAESGAREISIGVESGSERVLKLMQKVIFPDMVRATVRKLAEKGIRTKGYFIAGTPTETREELQMSVDLMHELREIAREVRSRIPVLLNGEKNRAQFRGSLFQRREYPGTLSWYQITGQRPWPDFITESGVEVPSYDEDTLLASLIPSLNCLPERYRHSFGTALKFSEMEPDEVAKIVEEAMQEQREDIISHGEFLAGVTDEFSTEKKKETKLQIA